MIGEKISQGWNGWVVEIEPKKVNLRVWEIDQRRGHQSIPIL